MSNVMRKLAILQEWSWGNDPVRSATLKLPIRFRHRPMLIGNVERGLTILRERSCGFDESLWLMIRCQRVTWRRLSTPIVNMCRIEQERRASGAILRSWRQWRGPMEFVGPPGGRLGNHLQEEERLRQGTGTQRRNSAALPWRRLAAHLRRRKWFPTRKCQAPVRRLHQSHFRLWKGSAAPFMQPFMIIIQYHGRSFNLNTIKNEYWIINRFLVIWIDELVALKQAPNIATSNRVDSWINLWLLLALIRMDWDGLGWIGIDGDWLCVC